MAGTHQSSSRRAGFSITEFVHHQAFGGILLLVCAIVAFVWANSGWGDSYDDLWHSYVTIGTSRLNMTLSLQHWVNDALMAIFFFVVGLEIKRELLAGELSSPRRAALPAVAAAGGVLVPALIYTAINAGGDGARGWGIPMATDIAFALGVLAVLGDRVPLGLKVFLTALAIVDDIIAVLVIALFYTSSVEWSSIVIAAAAVAVLVGFNRGGIRQPWLYGLAGIVLWVAVYDSGVHATIAGVLLAFTVPARTRIDPVSFVARGRALLAQYEAAGPDHEDILANSERQDALANLEDVVEGAGAPLQRMEHALHGWVAYLIVPVFALANAGVRIEGNIADVATDRVTLGVVLGLVLGKQIGVFTATWLAVRSGITSLPDEVTWRQIYGAGWLAGIGFTMALFVAELAFASDAQDDLLTSAKLGILIASVIAGAVGWWLLTRISESESSRANN